MARHLRIAAWALAIAGVGGAPFPGHAGQGSVPAHAASAAEFDSFLGSFRRALAQPGGDAIAAHTAWPFLFENRPLQRAAFVQEAVPALFTAAQRRCLQDARPVSEGAQRLLFCPPYGYLFQRGPQAWQLTEFFVDAD